MSIKKCSFLSYKHVGKPTCLYDIFSYPQSYIASQTYSISAPTDLPWIEDETSEYYLPMEERKADILFEGNSTGGVVSNIVVTDPDNDYRKNITLTFKDNKFAKFVVNAIGIKDFYFTPDQLTTSDMAWSARGYFFF